MSQYDPDRLECIYRRTDGRCHVCRKRLSLVNHGRAGRRGAWQIDHSHARAKGGSDHLNNLFPACISCNLDKGIVTSRTARASHGHTRAPLSRERKEEARNSRAVVGAGAGLLVGGALGGPPGALALALIGGVLGYSSVGSSA